VFCEHCDLAHIMAGRKNSTRWKGNIKLLLAKKGNYQISVPVNQNTARRYDATGPHDDERYEIFFYCTKFGGY